METKLHVSGGRRNSELFKCASVISGTYSSSVNIVTLQIKGWFGC